MKTLKKLMIALIITGVYAELSAQPVIGLKGGFTISSLGGEQYEDYTDLEYGDSYNFSAMPGLQFGITSEFELSDEFFLQSGLIFKQKGIKVMGHITAYEGYYYSEPAYTFKGKFNFFYLDIPINGMYKLELDDHFLLLYTGPSVNIGLSGQMKATYDYDDGEEEKYKESFEWGNDEDNDQFKRLELGWTFGMGFQFEELLQFRVSYNHGLNNISTYQEEDEYMTKNRVFQVSAVLLLNELDLF